MLLRRLRDAATAAERARIVLSGQDITDPVEMAYLHRLLEAAAAIEDYTKDERRTIEPASAYLGRLRYDPQTTASRQP